MNTISSGRFAGLKATQAVAIGVVAGATGIFAVALAYGGITLVRLGGSWYYLIVGLWLGITAFLLWRRSPSALWSYCGVLLCTALWAVWESGIDPWALLPRLAAPAGLGLILVGCTAGKWSSAAKPARVSTAVLSISSLALLVGCYFVHNVSYQPAGYSTSLSASSDTGVRSWNHFGGNAGGLRHSASTQINVDNVDELELAWSYRVSGGETAELSDMATAESTPIEVDGKLYFCASTNVAIALDADTGTELWRFDPGVALDPATHKVCRGVAFHGAALKDMACSARIVMGTVDNRLLALDAESGQPCAGFGDDGFVNLNDGLGVVPSGYNYVTSPPTILKDVVVVGSFVFDNQSTDEPPGVVRGYDVRTGELRWAWDVLHPEALPPLQPGETYPRNTPNVWSIASADEALGLLYLPTGNTPPDFFGGHRSAAQDRFGSSVVAIDINSGNVRWHYQTVNHDIWDYDIAAQPVAFQWNDAGRSVPALLVPTKRGEVFVLDRATGVPLTEVQELPVPSGAAAGEWLAPTQPFSTGMPSFAPADLEEASMWGATPLDQLWCRIEFRRARYDGLFTPHSTQGAIVYPGAFGVINWGSVSVDPSRNLMLVNTSYLPWYQKLIPRDQADELGIVAWGTPSDRELISPTGREIYYAQAGTPFAIDSRPFLSPLGYPCHEPPWGELAAVDLGRREIAWRIPLGTTRDVAPFGVALPTGIFNIGGPITTAGGLTFIAATVDNYFRAFDTETGAALWKARLPAGGQSNPISYVSTNNSRQYIVIAAGGHVPMQTTPGDYVLAYALPAEVVDREEGAR